MRKFTILFLLALAMTIGANQAFAASAAGGQSNNDKAEQSSQDNDGNGEPNRPGSHNLMFLISPDRVTRAPCTPERPCEERPRRPKLVERESEDCSCVHKVMRVNGRFMPFIDCYQPTLINGRKQLRYCRQ